MNVIIGKGLVVSTTSKTVKVDIDNASIVGGFTFEFDTKQMMDESQATIIANSLKEYLTKISKNVILEGTPLTPQLYVGDKVTISGTNTQYDGIYKIIALEINIVMIIGRCYTY